VIRQVRQVITTVHTGQHAYYTLADKRWGTSLTVESVHAMFPNTPENYLVVYTLDPDGPFTVKTSDRGTAILADERTGEELMVCFLPYEWDREMVRRDTVGLLPPTQP